MGNTSSLESREECRHYHPVISRAHAKATGTPVAFSIQRKNVPHGVPCGTNSLRFLLALLGGRREWWCHERRCRRTRRRTNRDRRALVPAPCFLDRAREA